MYKGDFMSRTSIEDPVRIKFNAYNVSISVLNSQLRFEKQ